jgi:hypothetical protein
MRALLISLLLLIAVVPSARAQERLGSIEGFVRDLSGEVSMLVPAVPFRVRVEREGYKPWDSDVLKPQPGQTVSVNARLLPAR